MNNKIVNVLLAKALFLFLLPYNLLAQNTDSLKIPPAPVPVVAPVKYPQVQFKGLFQARYLVGLTDNVDVNGLHHSDGNVTQNSFDIKRMRAQVRAKISERTEVVALVNLADFKSDPKNKVLENAYLKYTFNNYFAITVGQFRPWFGIEETYPVDIIKSMDFSNQYYEFGKNGWTSFQIGAALSGAVNIGTLPITYSFSVVNGNGRNQEMDKDNGKQYSTRIVMGLSKKNNVNFGLNAGLGEVFKKEVYAFGADITADFQLTDRLFFETQMEAKQAINHNLYFSLPADERTPYISNYQIRGFYFLPNLRYEIKYKKLSAIEFSCRYEYMDSNFRINSNVRQTLVPMLGFEFLKDYGARIQLGLQIDRFKHTIDDTTTHNNNLLLLQVQSRL
ncbi:porin [Flavobacterium supellecticarium]|uniref:Porin n=1 Tax=Flavobacterium supellecticarium TaxID=2565924 RepID=A0A4S4A2Q5_9FLAO|nr:porin [Flavobacterium supellecticarium]THF52690.1 porin [Flavobacterium supellecticarium]